MRINPKITVLKEVTYLILVKIYLNQKVTKITITLIKETVVTSRN